MRAAADMLDAIYWKTGGHCAYCGGALARGSSWSGGDRAQVAGAWHLDCWVPERAMGPEAREAANLWPACASCFADKAGRNGSEYVLERRAQGGSTHPLVEAFIDEVGDWFTRKLLGLEELTGTKPASTVSGWATTHGPRQPESEHGWEARAARPRDRG